MKVILSKKQVIFCLFLGAAFLLIFTNINCKKETALITPTDSTKKPTYKPTDVAGNYIVSSVSWSDTIYLPLGFKSKWTATSKDSVFDGSMYYHVDSTGFLTAPPQKGEGIYSYQTISGNGHYDSGTIKFNWLVKNGSGLSSGTATLTKY